jgi:diadenylate cyclase
MNSLLAFISSIRWQDVVDILFNSYILFRLYVLFRGTNVMRVIAGIALLWIFQRIAVDIGLIVTSWVMQGIVAGATLIIIIVFRNEIRNVLQAKNLRAILWEFPQKTMRTPIEGIVEGVYDLARTRTGALIVLLGKDDLDEKLQGGIEWQGLISKEMLLSVFWNGNPVHDGAAVIDGDRIARVGCILPLSQRDDLPHYYGTRHRAAVGLTEQTDALVVVVSEERGEVVCAKNGVVERIHDNLALARILRQHLGSPEEDVTVVKRERTELVTAAAICVLCMAGVWFSFAKGMETLTSVEVPLEIMNRDARMQILTTSVNSVRLYLSGSGTLISSLRPDQVKVKLDLSSAVNGDNVFMIGNDNIVMPPGVRLNRVEPSQVEMVLDMPVTKELPVQVDWVGALPSGLVLESVIMQPETVTLTGPSRILDEMKTVYTRKVPLDRVRTSGQLTTGLSLQRSLVKVAEGISDQVTVRYQVAQRNPQLRNNSAVQ